MGSAGHAFIAHTKALSPGAQAKDGGFGPPPHPLAARSGQRYWPRNGHRRRPFVVRSVTGDKVVGQRLDGGGETVRLGLRRLLHAGDDGQGTYYQLLGYSRRRYATHAYVVELDDRMTVLCVPEWHPRRPVRLFTRLVPVAARRPGAWLSLRCDLSASSAARLQPSQLEPVAAPEPGTVHPPAVRASVRV